MNIKMVRISLIFCFLVGFLMFGPTVDDIFSITVPQVDRLPQDDGASQARLDPIDPENEVLYPENETEAAHAPEMSTIVLVLSGAAGMIVRFVRKSFDRIKRTTDIALSLLLLVFSAPLLLVGSILVIITSPGPVIYKQKRMGRYGRIFDIYKLRTMYVGAEKDTGAIWAKKNDPRITPLGRVLRKLHIDELPQLFNVLNGQMSIVGPRPERPEIVCQLKALIPDYSRRLMVKPGITGLAQVWHKYDETLEDVKKKIKYDVLYIKRMCLLVDLRILFRTFITVLSGKGAN